MTSIEKETLLNIIELYKDMPYLWDKNNSDFKNKSLRHEGYKILLEIFKNFDPAATLKTLKKRIENMKAAYFREEKKVKSSKHSGAGSEEIHVPTLWYFDAFSFLGSATEPCRPVNDSLGNENADSSDDESQSGPTNAASIPKKKKKRTSLYQKQENILNIAEKALTNKEEDWECLGRSIGLQLKDLNEKSLTIVQKLISDAIYYAKIGRLTEDSYIVLASNQTRPNSSHQTTTHLTCRSSLSLHSPSSPLYSDSSFSPSSANPSPSHHISRIQLSSPSPQYQVQLPSQSLQYQVHQSPQYQVHQSPQYQVHQSPQYQVHQSPQYQVHQSPQYQIQLPSHSPQIHVQFDDSSGNYQLHIPEPSQDPTNMTGTQITQEENDHSPVASSNILIKGTGKDMKDFLIFKKNNK